MSLEETLSVVVPAAVGYLAYRAMRPNRKARRNDKKKGKSRGVLPLGQRLKWAGGILSANLLDRHTLVLGTIGGGKTSAIRVLQDELLSVPGVGLWCPTVKSTDLPEFLALCRRNGRSDVTVIGRMANSPTVNFLQALDDATLPLKDRARRIMAGLGYLGQALSRVSDGGDSDGGFWKRASTEYGEAVLELILMAGERPSARLMRAVIADIPRSAGDLQDPARQNGPFQRLMRRAFERKERGEIGEADFERVADYMAGVIVPMADRTRSSVELHLLNPLGVLQGGTGGDLLDATNPTLDIKALIARGGVLTTDLSYGDDPLVWVTLTTALTHLVFTAGLARQGAHLAPFISIIDEAHLSLTDFTPVFLSLARSSRMPTLLSAQCARSLETAFPGDSGRATALADAVVSNCGTRITALPTPHTARVVTEWVGQKVQAFFGGSTGGAEFDPSSLFWGGGGGSGSATGSFSTSHANQLTPDDLARMRTGGPEHDYQVDLFVYQPGSDLGGGKPFGFRTVTQLRREK